MQSEALPVRTDRHSGDGESSFHDMMAERLRQAPWFVVSAAAHAVVLLLLWLLVPPEQVHRAVNRASVVDTDTVELVQPTPPPVPDTEREEVVDPQVVTPSDLPDALADVPSADDVSPVPSAFQDFGTNPAVGLGPSAAGPGSPYGLRGKERGGKPGPGPAAMVAALTWLRRHQDEDGRWDCDQFMKHDDPALPRCTGAGNAVHDVGVTGLALLAFLGDGSTLRGGNDRDVVRRAVQWLRGQQGENGLIGSASCHDFLYDHAIAAYALGEAFGLSDYQLLRAPAQRAIDYLEAHRNPYGVWRYQPRDGDNDTSVTGWCIMAMATGKHFGLQVNDAALRLSAVWLDQVSDATGLHGYSKQGEPSSRKPGDHAARFPPDQGAAMTAVGLFCRFFLGQDPQEQPVMKAAANLLLQKPPRWDVKAGSIDHYYWYYASYALYQMGGPAWQAWQRKLEPVLVKNQHRDEQNTNLHGSWDPVCAWGEDGGRIYSTAILALTLQANWRYTRLMH
ncbi:MAG: prenyltransferase/squalene oxidase repeat-containing protein [Planctomycetota bacterium]